MSSWRKSTYSFSNGNCVEVDDGGDGMAVRDSKDPDGPVLAFDSAAWREFVLGIQGVPAPSFASSI